MALILNTEGAMCELDRQVDEEEANEERYVDGSDEDLEPAEMDSQLFQHPRLAATVVLEEDLPEPLPPVDHLGTGGPPPSEGPDPGTGGPPPPKRPRGRPRKQRQPPVPPPPPKRPPTPPPRVEPAAMEKFKADCARRKEEIVALTEGQREEKWALLVEDEQQRHIHCGDWLWADCAEESEINTDVKFTPPARSERFSPAAKAARTEMDFFQLFLRMPDLDNLVNETNRYAKQSGKKLATTRSSFLGYLGLAIAMPLFEKNTVEEYWSDNWLDHSFPEVMSSECFKLHLHYMHLMNERNIHMGDDGRPSDELHMVRPLLDSFIKSFHQHYRPGRELSINEMIIGSGSRSSTHGKDKPVEGSSRVWTLCDAHVPYHLNLDVYTGGDEEEGLSFDVVNQLMSQFLERGHRLYIDNFFTSPDLLTHLLDHKTLAVGTVSTNRVHMPARLRPTLTDVDGGQSIFLQSHGMTACRWRDRKDVFMLSTAHGKSLVPLTRRQKKDGQYQEVVVQKPSMFSDYNSHMRGVGALDQLRSYRPIARPGQRWWQEVFWRLIDVAILNAFTLWQLHHYPQTDPQGLGPKPPRNLHYRFRRALAEQLVSHQIEERAGVPRPSHSLQKKPLQHVGYPGRAELRRRCFVCRNPTAATFQTCVLCDDAIRVHHNICFYLLHSAADPRHAYQNQ